MIAKLGLPSGQTRTRGHPVRSAVGMLSHFVWPASKVWFCFKAEVIMLQAGNAKWLADSQMSTACAMQHALLNQRQRNGQHMHRLSTWVSQQAFLD